jgi:hypothetical protein
VEGEQGGEEGALEQGQAAPAAAAAGGARVDVQEMAVAQPAGLERKKSGRQETCEGSDGANLRRTEEDGMPPKSCVASHIQQRGWRKRRAGQRQEARLSEWQAPQRSPTGGAAAWAVARLEGTGSSRTPSSRATCDLQGWRGEARGSMACGRVDGAGMGCALRVGQY